MTRSKFAALCLAVPLLLAFAVVAIGGFDMHALADHARHAAIGHDLGSTLLASPLAALRATRLDIVAKMTALIEAAETEDRDLTAEESTTFEGMKAERDTLDRRIGRLETMSAAQTALDAVVPGAGRHVAIVHPPAPGARREFESMGEFLAAVRFNPNDQRLVYDATVGGEAEGIGAELRMDDGASGGFMIPAEFRPGLLQVTPQEAIVRPRAMVLEPGTSPDAAVTMAALDQTGVSPGNMFGGVEVRWIGEGDDKPETNLKLREITLTPHEVAGTIVITDKLLRNWRGSSALIETQFRGAIRQAEDFAFLRGDGIKKPLGILNSPALLKVNRKTANQITYDDVVEMLARGYGNGVFVYSRSAEPTLMKMTDPAGHYIWIASAREGEPATLAGRPAIRSDRNPLVGQLGDLWYGDLSNYLIKDGSGPFVAASEHVLFRQNKTVIKAFWNVDGAPWLTAPLRLENNYLVSPFVALDIPAA